MNNPLLQEVKQGEIPERRSCVAIDFPKWKMFDENGKEIGQVWRRSENLWLWGAPRSDADSNSNQCDITTSMKLEDLYHRWLGKQVVS